MNTCPRCKQKTEKAGCDACALIFADYERNKRSQMGKVYQLISAGQLEQAKELAQQLSTEFPESKGDFILLISNINRDLNITKKYQQAKTLFEQGKYDESILLLRNIKAFDPRLEEKIITLRRRIERNQQNQHKVHEAVEHFEHKRYSQAKKIFQHLGDHPDAQKYLKKIDTIQARLLHEIQDALAQHLFHTAREKAFNLSKLFPEASQERPALFTLLDRRKEINERLLAAAHKAKEEKRLIEAKALYFFLLWQNHELKPLLLPYIEEIGADQVLTLADCSSSNEFVSLGFLLDEEGFLKPLPQTEEQSGAEQGAEKKFKPRIAPVLGTPESLADSINEPVYIDGEELADFTA